MTCAPYHGHMGASGEPLGAAAPQGPGGLFYFGVSVLALTRHRRRSMSHWVVDGLLKVYR